MVKKSLVSDLPGPAAQTFRLANVNDGDRLGWAVLTDSRKEILLATARGMTIRFSEEEVRPMGLAAAGVNGIKLGVGDEVIGVQVLPVEGEIFLVTADGKAKRVEQKDFPPQGRYGKGVIGWELPARVSLAGLAAGKKNDIVTLHLAKAAPKMTRLDAAPLRKRSAVRGEAVVDVRVGDGVVGVVEAWLLERFVQKKEPKRAAKK
jgi:DNA gyrase subunit A